MFDINFGIALDFSPFLQETGHVLAIMNYPPHTKQMMIQQRVP